VRSKSGCAIKEDVESDNHERIYSFLERSIRPEKTRHSIERNRVSKNWIKQSHTLPVFHFNRCLTTEYSEKTAHCNGNFDTDKQIQSTVA
jgi:hypothetical protein